MPAGGEGGAAIELLAGFGFTFDHRGSALAGNGTCHCYFFARQRKLLLDGSHLPILT
ncbi:hypothetical protein D3C73_1648190 [compost metagenome]